jgi:hypothetical protein
MLRRAMMAGTSVTYATWNPSDKTTGFTLTGGNLIATENSSNLENVRSTIAKASGKAYAEVLLARPSGTVFNCLVGLRRSDESISTVFNAGQTMVVRTDASVYAGSSGATTGTGTTFTFNDRLMIAVDFDAALLWIGKNGTWMNSGNPAAGTGAMFSGFTAAPGWCVVFCADNTATQHRATINTGQSAFAYTVPSGFPSGWFS